jgi:hypothetical protein
MAFRRMQALVARGDASHAARRNGATGRCSSSTTASAARLSDTASPQRATADLAKVAAARSAARADTAATTSALSGKPSLERVATTLSFTRTSKMPPVPGTSSASTSSCSRKADAVILGALQIAARLAVDDGNLGHSMLLSSRTRDLPLLRIVTADQEPPALANMGEGQSRRRCAPSNPVRLLRLLRVVLWSFLGVRRGADAARDMEGVQPHMVLLVGVLVAAIFVISIVVVVRLILGEERRSSPRPPWPRLRRRPRSPSLHRTDRSW